jgi:ribosomal protein L37AE/L43A
MNPLNQNPNHYECQRCGMCEADEFYFDMWLCIDCATELQEEDEIE